MELEICPPGVMCYAVMESIKELPEGWDHGNTWQRIEDIIEECGECGE